MAVTAATGIAATHICGASNSLQSLSLVLTIECLSACVDSKGARADGHVLACAGTTLHRQAGCGVPRTYDDFGRMWRTALDRWRKLKACCCPCSLVSSCSSNTMCCWTSGAGVTGLC